MIIEYVVITLFGLCLGSFFNVCIHRFPKEKSIVSPGSACPKCETPIKWYDNIPVLSYMLLRGKCRHCDESIAFRYPFVEILTAATYCFCFYKLGLCADFFSYCFLFSVCIVVSFIDIDYRAIPGWMCIVGMLVGNIIALVHTIQNFNDQYLLMDYSQYPIVKSLVGSIVAMGAAYFLKLIGDLGLWVYLSLIKKEDLEGETEALGLGDVDFLGMVGAFLGWKLGVLTFFIAPFVSIVYGVYLIVGKKSHLIAYLPFLSIATLITAFWGNDLLRLIFGG